MEFHGKRFLADVKSLSTAMARERVPLSEQKVAWIDFSEQYPQLDWIDQCLQQVERTDATLRKMEQLVAPVSNSQPQRVRPPYAQRQFVWLGDRFKIPSESLRGGIANMAQCGFISTDEEQQSALRRGLGLATTEAERHAPIPWVDWRSDADLLNHLINCLWDLELIYCQGGSHQKWNTACDLFLHHGSDLLPRSLKSNRCRNRHKTQLLDEALFDGLENCIHLYRKNHPQGGL